MFNRILKSALVSLAISAVAGVTVLLLIWLDVRYLASREPGVGYVAGGLFPFFIVMAATFLGAFAWNWHRKSN
jgi:hypothetical protein